MVKRCVWGGKKKRWLLIFHLDQSVFLEEAIMRLIVIILCMLNIAMPTERI